MQTQVTEPRKCHGGVDDLTTQLMKADLETTVTLHSMCDLFFKICESERLPNGIRRLERNTTTTGDRESIRQGDYHKN